MVVTRLRVPPGDEESVSAAAREVLDALSTRPGFLSGQLGRAADDQELWLLASRWTGAGTYRRALSSYDLKIVLAPLMSYVVAEPSAYDVVVAVDAPSGADG